MSEPIMTGRVVFVPALVLFLIALAVSATAEDWPETDLGPIPGAVVPEAVNSDEAAVRDAIEAGLREMLLRGPTHEAPSESSPNLISWIIEIVSYAEHDELEHFSASYSPEDWAAADLSLIHI